jgi:hypothetical protein
MVRKVRRQRQSPGSYLSTKQPSPLRLSRPRRITLAEWAGGYSSNSIQSAPLIGIEEYGGISLNPNLR